MTTAADKAQLQSQGLYDPSNEHDACGVGFVAHIKGQKSHAIVGQALKILENLDHRGAVGADALMGDGAGILIQLPDALYREEMAKQGVTLPPQGEYGVGMVFQDPMSSLDPLMTIGDQVAETLRLRGVGAAEARRRALSVLDELRVALRLRLVLGVNVCQNVGVTVAGVAAANSSRVALDHGARVFARLLAIRQRLDNACGKFGKCGG